MGEATTDLKALGDDFTKKLGEIVASVGEVKTTINAVRQENSEIKGKIHNLETKKEPEDDDDEDFADPTEKKIKTLEQEISTLKKDQSAKDWSGSYLRECQIFDGQAISKFPQLKDQASQAYIETQKILSTIKPIGKDPKSGEMLLPPDALLNAAYRAKVEFPNAFASTRDDDDDFEDMGGVGGGGSGKKIKGREITEIQKAIAERLGVKDTESLRNRCKEYNVKKIKRASR